MERRLDREEFIIDPFCRIGRVLLGIGKRSDASLWPGEIATLGVLFALKGTSERAFDRWLRRQWLGLFPRLPHRTRLLFAAHRDWTDRFLARPSFFGVADSYGIELINTRRLKRSPRQIARKGKCAGRWIAGVKWGLVINNRGQVCAWDVTTANVYDANAFAPLIERYAEKMIVLADGNFHTERAPPQERSRPAEPEDLPARLVEPAAADRTGALDAAADLPPEASERTELADPAGPSGLCCNGLQPADPMDRPESPAVHRTVRTLTSSIG